MTPPPPPSSGALQDVGYCQRACKEGRYNTILPSRHNCSHASAPLLLSKDHNANSASLIRATRMAPFLVCPSPFFFSFSVCVTGNICSFLDVRPVRSVGPSSSKRILAATRAIKLPSFYQQDQKSIYRVAQTPIVLIMASSVSLNIAPMRERPCNPPLVRRETSFLILQRGIHIDQ